MKQHKFVLSVAFVSLGGVPFQDSHDAIVKVAELTEEYGRLSKALHRIISRIDERSVNKLLYTSIRICLPSQGFGLQWYAGLALIGMVGEKSGHCFVGGTPDAHN